MKWQRIETAPKDGSEILVFRDGEVSVAMWRHPFLDSMEQAEWLSLTATDPNGSRSACRMEARFPHEVVHSGSPTHWMPLPKPPMSQEARHARAVKAAAARAAKLSPERRSEIARIGGRARWAKESACTTEIGSA